MFDPVDPRQSFSELEHGILAYWKKEDIFRRSLRARQGNETFRFYDGPPFATGLPHYGHLIGGTIKDVIPRYQTMRGKYVQRRFGWDCHGLPVEYEIEKEHGIKGKKDIEAMGIGTFNALCRSAVQRYVKEWRVTVERMGRWVDMDWDYRTMDPDYMESIWWVFKELWNKKLIEEGHKPMHVCPRCVTPLSNFEVTQGYKDVTDLGVVVKFLLKDEKDEKEAKDSKEKPETWKLKPETYALAWTTTPWTLPGNQFLAVKPRVQYVRVRHDGDEYIVAKKCVERIFGEMDYTIVGNPFTSQELVGKRYEPVFPYFANVPSPMGGGLAIRPRAHGRGGRGGEEPLTPTLSRGERGNAAFRIVAADFVTTDEGTGIVHIAPGFGEDDYRVWEREKVPLLQHVTMDGKFIDEVKDFAGLDVKPKDDPMKTDRKLVAWLEEKGYVFLKETLRHSYPHCWRCDTPLLNYATSSWFVKLEKIKEDLLTANKETEWVPEHLRDGRFGKWLEGARDWAISRQRYWGTPLPIWRVEDNLVVIGSRDDLMDHCRIRFTKVTVLRHGESEGNLRGIYQGAVPGTGLTEDGKGQACTAAESLRTTPIAAIYASPLRRTQETAAILAEALGTQVFTDDRLRESGFGPYEGKPIGPDERAFLRAARRNPLLDPKNPDHRSQAAGMELWGGVQERIDAFFADVLPHHRSDHIVIISHVDPMQNIRHFFTQEDPTKIVRRPYPLYATPETYFFDHNREAQMDLHCDSIDDVVWPGSPSTSSVTLTLVRHGETDWNKENKSQGGQSDIPLNERGREQARELAKKLGGGYDIIISSDLSRAVETAEIIAKELGIPHEEKCELLRERHTGDWGGQPYDAILARHSPPPHLRGGTTTLHHVTPPNGESLSAFLTRATVVYAELLLKYPGKRVLCVTHAGMIRALRILCENPPYAEAASWKIGNTENITIALHPLMRRIPDVLDCWFESGAMPYAENHYPFAFSPSPQPSPALRGPQGALSESRTGAGRGRMPPGFPADFIAEGIDMTRGWFYTLMVLSTALFKRPAFRHCVVNGIVLAEDGKKMSKRLKNYPDPLEIAERHGADALRFAMMRSPAVRAEELRFGESLVEETVRSVLLPLWNAYSFFVTYANLARFEPLPTSSTSSHPLDQWIRAEIHDCTNRMTKALDRYDLSKACGEICDTIDALTNWYIRLSRRRFAAEQHTALATLYDVLLTLMRLLAPFCPFITEAITRNLVPEVGNSVHCMDWPNPRPLTPEEEGLLRKNRVLRRIVSLGLRARSEAGLKLRQPLTEAHIALPPFLLPLATITREDRLLLEQELNVESISLLTNPGILGERVAFVDARKTGPRLGARVQDIIAAGKRSEFEEREDGSFRILDEILLPEEVHIVYQGKDGEHVQGEGGIVVSINTHMTDALLQKGLARDLIRTVQRLRKESGLSLTDSITLQIDGADDVIIAHKDLIERETRATMGKSDRQVHEADIDGRTITLRFHHT